jgi:alpha-mannosidase
MLEKLRRTRAIGKRHDAGGQIPLVKMGGSFEEFYESVRKETDNGAKLPNWRGELYAEFHRGTYTSHGSIKKGNRKGENLLREAEYAATMASLIDSGFYYPKEVSLTMSELTSLSMKRGRTSCYASSTMSCLVVVSA